MADRFKGMPTNLTALSQIEVLYATRAFNEAHLVGSIKGGFELWLHVKDEVLVLARREGDQARRWRSVDNALRYIASHFEEVQFIHIHLSSQERN